MPTRNINLTDHFDQFVKQQIGEGRYKNANEVLRAGLRLLEQQEATDSQKLKLLKSLTEEGFRQLDQGEGLVASSRDELRTIIAQIGRRAAKKSKQKRID